MSAVTLVAVAAGAAAALLVEHGLRTLLDPGPTGLDDWGQPHTQKPLEQVPARPHGAVTTRRLKAVP